MKKILDVSWSMWEERNKVLHGASAKEARDKQLSLMHSQVQNLYHRAALFDTKTYPDLGKVFQMTKEKRLKKGLVALKTWTTMATDILIKVEKREARSIERWLKRKETYIGGM